VVDVALLTTSGSCQLKALSCYSRSLQQRSAVSAISYVASNTYS